jgi:anthranilate/para-aminobenzoate synthase component I
MQTSILIRTFVADGKRLTLHVGGGITWRSDAAAEWDETVAKARGPLEALGGREIDAVRDARGSQSLVAPR